MTPSATSRSLLAVTLIGCQIFVSGFAWSQQQPRSRNEAPWSVQVARNKYYTGLDAARAEAIRKVEAEGLTLSYNTDGTVVSNTALEKATQYYNEQRQKLLNEVKGDQRRDVELETLRNSANVAVPRDTGTGIEHPDYSGALSDRDVTLGSKAEVERMKAAAQERGYHCVQGPGYIKIMELDTVLWDPSTFGPGATILRHDDPEVVLGYEKPSVVQQIKKIEQNLRQEIPTSTQEQHELVSNLAKAATKSAKAVDPDHTGLVMTDAERHQLEQLKSRRLTQDDLISTFDRPEAKERKLRDLKREAVDTLEKCDPLQREQRKTTADTLRNRRAELATALLKENDPLKVASLRERISDLDEGLKSIQKAEDLDNATQRAITRKNPNLAETLNWTEKKTDRTNPIRPGEMTRNARLLNEAQEVVAGPVETSSSRAKDVWSTATEVNKTISDVLGSPLLRVFAQVAGIPQTYVEAADKIARTTKKLDEALFDPVNQGINSEGFVYETGEGMKEYIRREIQATEQAGYDVTNARWQQLVRRKAILRATARGTYEGSKSLPGQGKIVQGFEDTYKLTESTVGLVYDTWKSQQIVDMNRFQQEGQLDKALIQAVAARDRLRAQVDAASRTIGYTEALVELLPRFYEDLAALQQQIKDRTLLLEQLTSKDQSGDDQPDAIGLDELQNLGPRIAAVIRTANTFIQDCDKAIERARARRIAREILAEEQGALRRRMMDLDAEYIRISDLLDRAAAFVRLVSDPLEARQIHELLLLDYGQAAALAGMAEDIAGKLERNRLLYKDLLRCFKEEKQRIKDACDYFSTRPVGDPKLQEKLSRIRGEITGFVIKEYQLEDNVSQASDLKHEAVWLRRMAGSPPPFPTQANPPTPALIAEVEQIQSRLNVLDPSSMEMTMAVETARARLKQLQELLPLDPPAFSLRFTEIGPGTLGLAVDAVRVPKNAQLVYSWDFGDGKRESSREPATKHAFAKPGEYPIVVRVFEETSTLSVELGEARAIATLGTAPPPVRPTGPHPVELTFSTNLLIDGDSAGDDPLRAVIRKAGQFHVSSSVLRLTYVPGSTRMESDFELELSLKVSDEFFFPSWKLHASGQATGPFDPQAGTLRLTTGNVKWSENVPMEFPILGVGGKSARGQLSPEQHAFAMNEAHRMMGVAPSQLPWSGQVNGTIDWKNFGGGQGRLELNKVFRGTWKVDPGAPYYVRLADDITAPDGKRRPLLRLYPNPSAAMRAYNGWSRSGPLLMGGKKNLTDFGDEAVWSPAGGILVRIGRWHLDLSRPAPYRSSNPEQLRPLLDKVQAFISECGLETSLPELPEQ